MDQSESNPGYQTGFHPRGPETNAKPAAGPRAHLGKRTAAFILDRLIINVAASVLSAQIAQGAWETIVSAQLVMEFLYAGYFYSERQATPGKMALGLVVVSGSGAKLSFLQAGLRDSLGKLLSVSILGIGYFIAFFRRDKRALHDLIFDTHVLEQTKSATDS